MVLTIQFKTLNKFNKTIRYFGNKSRYETMTDLVFITDNLIICADLSDKILYLVEINYDLETSKILHQVNLPHHPDLIERRGNLIYVVNLNDYLTVCELNKSNTGLVVLNNIPIKFGAQYHGLCVNPNNTNELFLASTRKYKLLTVYDVDNGVVNNLVIPKLEHSYLKDITFISGNLALIIGSDSGPCVDKLVYKSYLNLYRYENGKFTYLDGLTYTDCHMDSVVFAKGHYFVTAQINEVGALLTGTIEDGFIIPMKNIDVADFPHGLAISKSQKFLGHTSYSAGTVTIEFLDNFI